MSNRKNVVSERLSGNIVDNGVGADSVGVTEKRTRKVDSTLSAFRASINKEVMQSLIAKEEDSGIERGILVETALRLFFDAPSDARKEALKAVRANRVQNENDNI